MGWNGNEASGYLCIDTCVLVIIHCWSAPEVIDRVSKTLNSLKTEDLVKRFKVVGLGLKWPVHGEGGNINSRGLSVKKLLGSGKLRESLPR